MTFDRFAEQTHRRGFLAAVVALALPATARAQHWQCSPPGGGCTLSIDCCGDVTCVRQPLNPNSGVCGGVLEDNSAGPMFIAPTGSDSAGEGASNASSGFPLPDTGYLTRAELLAKYDTNGDGDLNCLEDFNGDHGLAQAAYDDNPTDPFRLDQGGIPGVPCEMLL